MVKRKQGSRAQKRAEETYTEFSSALIDQAEEDRVTSRQDDDLFVLDTDRKDAIGTSARNKAARRAANREKLLAGVTTTSGSDAKRRKYEPSDKDLRQIQKVLQHHGKDGAIALALRGKARMEQKRHAKRMNGMTPKSGKPTYDLWDDAAVATADTTSKKKSKLIAVATGKPSPNGISPVDIVSATKPLPVDPNFEVLSQQPTKALSNKHLKARKHAQLTAKPTLALEVAHPGQSYRPDKEQHQDAIGEALSIEIRRNEAEEYKSKPISSGMSEFTKRFIVGESDSEESSDEEEEDDDDGNVATMGATKLIKKKEKLTRAQRNKQKRVKAEQTALFARKQSKQFNHQINEVHKHSKAVKEEEKLHSVRQSELAQLRDEKKSQPLGKNLWNAVSQVDPLRAPSLPVALTEELEGKSGGKGSLRTVTPKGSLVTDRLESMVARGLVSKKKVDGRRIVQGKRRKKVMGVKGTEYLLI